MQFGPWTGCYSRLFAIAFALLAGCATAGTESGGDDDDDTLPGQPDASPLPGTPDAGRAVPQPDARPIPPQPDAAPIPQPDAAPQGTPVTLTHSQSQDITDGGSVWCGQQGGAFTPPFHFDSHYYRTFTLTDFSIDTELRVTAIEVGVQQAISAFGNSQPARIVLSTLTGPLETGTRTPLTSVDVTVLDVEGQVVRFPVSTVVPAGSTLVVEFATPSGQAAGNALLIGANAAGEDAPSYLAAAQCGTPDPKSTADLNFPNVHMVINVQGLLPL